VNTHLVFVHKRTNRVDAVLYQHPDPEGFALIRGLDPERHFLLEVESDEDATRLFAMGTSLLWGVYKSPREAFIAPSVAVTKETAPVLNVLGRRVHVIADYWQLRQANVVYTTSHYDEASATLDELLEGEEEQAPPHDYGWRNADIED
jgi:hypothetical protein